MASGDLIVAWPPLAASLPTSNYPQFNVRNNHPVLEFDDTTDETAYFEGVLPSQFAAVSLVVRLVLMAKTAVTGSSRWEVGFERHAAAGTDLDADDFATALSGGVAADATSGKVMHLDLTFTTSQIDGLVGGEHFRLLVRRDANGTTGTDDMVGDAQLLAVWLREA